MKYVFLVGSPRSGTSWLQLLLAQHPKVTTTLETHLFGRYLFLLRRQWERFESWPSAIGGRQILTDAQFDELCADFARKVLQRIADTDPAATVALEKTPDHVRHGPFILRLLPEVHFIHLIRDPRSVVSSLSAAARSWGRNWPPRSVVKNARQWRTDVGLGREIAGLTQNYTEVRFERLRSVGGPEVLLDLFSWLDLEADVDFCERALLECRIERLRQGGEGVRAYQSLKRPEPHFIRKGSTEGWNEDLSRGEIAIVEYIAGSLMKELGYTSAFQSIDDLRKPLGLRAHDALDSVERQLRKGLKFAVKKARSVA